MTKARDIASATTPNANAALLATFPHRNLIINGAMQVVQRGTVATGGSTGLHYGGPDRWRMYQENTAAAYTLSQDTNVPLGQGFAYSYKIDVTTADATVAAADRADFLYRFEGQDLQQIAKGTSGAKAMTLSFWVSSPKTGVHTVEFFDNDNVRQISKTYTINSANTWEYKVVTFPADTTGAFDNDNALSLQVGWWLMAGSNFTGGTFNSSAWASNTNANRVSPNQVNVMDSTSNNFYLTGFQLEVGDTATPFEHRSFGDELARCQRYYAKSYSDGVAAGTVTSVGAIMVYSPATGNTMRYTLHYPQQMRATPTFTPYNPETGTSGYGAFEGQGATNQEVVGYTFNGNKSALLFNTNMNLTGSFYWQWSLDAEL
jgi:hypothetical protein